MKMYRTNSYSDKIECIEVVKRTEKSVTYNWERFDGSIASTTQHIETGGHNWHETYEDAKYHLIHRYKRMISGYEHNLQQAKESLAKVQQLQEVTND